MDAGAQPLLSVFEGKIRLEVPLFQRTYVWTEDRQWQPFWEDISRKFSEYLSGRKDGPIHFLGAMVLDQKQTPVRYVPKRQIIDGQQRLTTIQIFLAAFRDFCRSQHCDELAEECEKYILNTGMMADRETEQFKVWPTQLDRPIFRDVMTLGSRGAVETRYPLIKRKYVRRFEPRPQIVEAYVYFYAQLHQFVAATVAATDGDGSAAVSDCLDECFQALTNAIHVVVIDLQAGDDPQVIFETLNARGEPLLPADLLRNYIFLRAARSATDKPEDLYERYWRGFDDEFWRKEVRQGRLTRPRSDLFMQHFLASERVTDIPVKHLYVEYKYWIEKFRPFSSVTEELATLASQSAVFRRFLDPQPGDAVARLASVLDIFDVGTVYPLLLAFAKESPSDTAWRRLSDVVESFLVRRSVCGWTTQNYNRLFLGAIKGGATVESIAAYLLAGQGESVAWPNDDMFHASWLSIHAYQTLNNGRIVHILRRVSDHMVNARMEDVTVNCPLTVEHLLPQRWTEHWTLPDGSKGLTPPERFHLPDGDVVKEQSQIRDRLLQTFGNLTLLTQPLNSAVSNGPWTSKKPEILKSSLLPLNQVLHDETSWDEESIRRRGERLFTHAVRVWPHGIGA